MYFFTEVNKFLRKNIFKKWLECSSLSNDWRFLSVQTIQKIHKKAALQTFLHFFPTNKLCHLKRASLIVAACTQWIPKRSNNNRQRILTCSTKGGNSDHNWITKHDEPTTTLNNINKFLPSTFTRTLAHCKIGRMWCYTK